MDIVVSRPRGAPDTSLGARNPAQTGRANSGGLPDGHGDVVAAYAETRNVAEMMMSGYPNGMDTMQNNNRPYLMKPFGHATLSAVVSFVLEGRSGQQPAEGATC
jgi:hypothetical protein